MNKSEQPQVITMIDNLGYHTLSYDSSYEKMFDRSIGFYWLFSEPSAILVFCWVTESPPFDLRTQSYGSFELRLLSTVCRLRSRARLPGQLVRGTKFRVARVAEVGAFRCELNANVARFRQALVQSFQACHDLSAGISSGLCRQNFQNIFEPT